MRKTLFILVLIAGVLAACGADAVESEPASPTGTQAEKITDTPVPTATEPPTETPVPTSTNSPTPTATATETLEPPKWTITPSPERGGAHVARLRFDVREGSQITVVLNSTQQEFYEFSSSWNLELPWGDYSYLVWVDGNGPFTGSFKVKNVDKHTMVIYADKVRFQYP